MHSGLYNAPFLVTIYHPTHNHWNPSMYILWYITWNSLYILKLLECAHPFLLRNLFLSWIYCFTYRSLKWWFFFFFSHTVWATRCEGDLPTPHWCFQTILHFFFLFTYLHRTSMGQIQHILLQHYIYKVSKFFSWSFHNVVSCYHFLFFSFI